MARLAIYAIRVLRERADKIRASVRMPNAFVISSLKRRAEVELLRAVYGESFVLIGVRDFHEAVYTIVVYNPRQCW